MTETTKRREGIFHQHIPMTITDWLVDVVIAAGAFGFAMMQMSLSAQLFVPDDFTRRILGIQSVVPSLFAMVAAGITCVPLIARRRFAWPVFIAVLLLWMFFDWVCGLQSLSLVSPLVALFTVAYERGRQEAFIAGSITLVIALLAGLGGETMRFSALFIFQNITFVIAVTLAGYALHTRQEYLEEAQARVQEVERLRISESKRAYEAERTRESEASRRVEEERVRIAREVHDITAHSLSAVNIQATAAERLVDSDPEAARQAMGEVRKISKTSLEDIRAMISVLRAKDESDGRAPTVGTECIGDLVNYLEEAHVQCDLISDRYERSCVPVHTDVALFGIAREACTNIVRHAHAKSATIELACEAGCARLTVSDDGCGMPDKETSQGHGIEGMRERANLLGGHLVLSENEPHGTVVEVSIPLESDKMK